jgi:glyoxylase-like metal-dependent hydrolase (beta-lactamase superfamily II)
VRLGAGIELETMKLSGHVSDELAFYESSTETLILGDAITSFRWDHLQGHESPKAYRHAIAKLRAFMQQRRPKRVLMAHHSDQTPQYLSTLLDEAETFLDKMDELVLSTIARAHKPVSLGKLWAIASAVTNKDQDLYGLITVHAHARELVENGTLASPAPNLYVI